MIDDNHRHTGLDSQKVDYNDLLNTPSSNSASWTAVSGASSFTISSLTGDTAKAYRLLAKLYFNTAESLLHLRLNADTGSNYHYSIHRHGVVSNADVHSQATSSALANNKEAYIVLYDGSFIEAFLDLTIYATSGHVRMVQGKLTTYVDLDTWTQQDPHGIWTNTADEVTSIKVTAGQNFLTGSEYSLTVI